MSEDIEEVEKFRQALEDQPFGELIDKLVKLRLESLSSEDLTEKSKLDLKRREVKRELNERFLRNGSPSESSESSSGGVSKISDLLSFN